MPNNEARKQISIHSLLEVVRRRLRYVLVPAVALMALVVLYAVFQPARWRAEALLGIDNDMQGFANSDSTPVRVQDQLLTIRETVYSRDVLEPVIRQFGLYPATDGKISEQSLELMKARLKIQLEREDSFHLSFEGSDRRQAMEVTNRLAELFVQRLSSVREKRVSQAADVLAAELDTLRAKLTEQDERLKQYKERAVNALPDRLETNLRLFETTQAERQSRHDRRATDEARLAAVREEMAQLEKQGVLQPAPPREKSAAVAKLDDMKVELRQAQSKYTDSHPEIQRLKEEIGNMEKTVAAMPVRPDTSEPTVARMRHMQLKAEKESLERRIASYGQEEQAMDAQLNRLQARVNSTPTHEIAISELSRDYEATKVRYNELLAKQQQARLAGRMQSAQAAVSFKIIEPAPLPTAPATPRPERLVIMGLFASIGFGLVCAFVVEQMDTSFDNVDAFQEFTNFPILTVLPSISGAPGSGVRPVTGGSVAAEMPQGCSQKTQRLAMTGLHNSRIVTLTDPHAVASEQYKILALKIRQHFEAVRSPVLVITSSIGGEGKTLTSINLAMALAASGQGRVLLLESDLRKPRIHEYLGLTPTMGFSDLLVSPEDDWTRYTWKIKDLFVMPGGSSLANPVELLASGNAKKVLERLRCHFSMIIVDAPPVLPIVDTHMLAGMADGVMLVVRARYTRREIFQRAIESFQTSNLMGAALNDVDYERSRYAYAYRYYSKHYLTGS